MQHIDEYQRSQIGVATDYAHDLAVALAALDTRNVDGLLAHLETAVHTGRGVFVCGNGGSAATASHLAYDLSSAALDMGYAPCRIQALSDSPVRLTAIANDTAYDQIFARQLAASAIPGDVLLILSVSGESPNVIAAARHARDAGMQILAVVGKPSAVVDLSDATVTAGAADYGVSEDIQLAVGHMAVRLIRQVRRFTCGTALPPAEPQRRILERSG